MQPDLGRLGMIECLYSPLSYFSAIAIGIVPRTQLSSEAGLFLEHLLTHLKKYLQKYLCPFVGVSPLLQTGACQHDPVTAVTIALIKKI